MSDMTEWGDYRADICSCCDICWGSPCDGVARGGVCDQMCDCEEDSWYDDGESCQCPACGAEPEETHCWTTGRFVRTWWTCGALYRGLLLMVGMEMRGKSWGS